VSISPSKAEIAVQASSSYVASGALERRCRRQGPDRRWDPTRTGRRGIPQGRWRSGSGPRSGLASQSRRRASGRRTRAAESHTRANPSRSAPESLAATAERGSAATGAPSPPAARIQARSATARTGGRRAGRSCCLTRRGPLASPAGVPTAGTVSPPAA
jgi:hypothetical protein